MARQRADGAINAVGLPELSRALKAIDKETGTKLRGANKSVATFVADDARAAAQSLGGVAAHVANSVKPAAGAAFAGVAGGGPAHPAFGGAEFGSDKYKQFQPWRGNGEGAGYFVYPTIRRDGPRIETEYRTTIDDLLKEVGLA